jgi:hypothetical protein
MTDEAVPGKGMDPLKAYCLVLAVLVLVLGFFYLKISGERADYESANAVAERLLTARPSEEEDEEPYSIPSLAWQMERYVASYKEAAGGGGGLQEGIPAQMMTLMETEAGVTPERALREVSETKVKNRTTVKTITQQFDYKSTTLRNLLTLSYNIESRGRYRVSDIRWQLADPKENSQPPFHMISKPSIKVAVRSLVARTED